MTTWWFAGLLQGAVSIATDDRAPLVARHTMAEVAADLTEHWAFNDQYCERIETMKKEKTKPCRCYRCTGKTPRR